MAELLTSTELDGIRLDVTQIFEDQGKIERITSLGTLDHERAVFMEEERIEIYSGGCYIAPIISRRDRFDEVGQGLVFSRQYRVDIPFSETEVQIRDIFTATVSSDPMLAGRPMLVRDVIVGTNVGYRRLTVQDTGE